MEFKEIVKEANGVKRALLAKNNLKLTNCLDKNNAYLFYNSLFRTQRFEPNLTKSVSDIFEYPNKRSGAVEIPLMLIDVMRGNPWIFGGYTNEQRQAISAAAITNKDEISKKVCDEWAKNRIPYVHFPLVNPFDAIEAFVMDETKKAENDEKVERIESFYRFVKKFDFDDVCPVGLILTLDFVSKGNRQDECQRIYESIHTNVQPDTKYIISRIIRNYSETMNMDMDTQTPTGKIPDNINDILSII